MLPTTVGYTLVIFGPGSPYWGPPFLQGDDDLFVQTTGAAPSTLSAVTTTLILSEPVTAGTAPLPTVTANLTAVSPCLLQLMAIGANTPRAA